MGGTVQIRDSKDPDGPILTFSRDGWAAFIDEAKKGEYDVFYPTNYAVPPGATLAEWLEERHMKQAELAPRIDMSEEAMSQVIAGAVPLTRATAANLELVTGIPARIWNQLESVYQEDRSRLAGRAELEA